MPFSSLLHPRAALPLAALLAAVACSPEPNIEAQPDSSAATADSASLASADSNASVADSSAGAVAAAPADPSDTDRKSVV